MADQNVTSVSEWKKSAAGKPLELPSGKVCLVRTMGVQAFLAGGMIPNSLLPIVQEALENAKKGKAPSQKKLEEAIENNPEQLLQVFDMADAITCHVVIEPHVHPVPPDIDGMPAERDPELLYVDEIDVEDKMYVMSVAMGGAADLERFRREFVQDVADVSAGDDVARPAKRAGGARKR